MDRIRTLLTFALALSLIGALSLGCNTGTEEPDAPATDTAAAKPAEVAPEQIDPSRFPELPDGQEAAVPESYPSDLPVYPGAVPAQGRGTDSEEGQMAAIQLLTNDAPERAFDYYRGELESKGWVIEKAESGGEAPAISVIKDGCKATFMFIPSETGTGTDIFSISACAEES